MAAPVAGHGLPARPSDGYRLRKNEDGSTRAAIPRNASLTAPRDTEIPRLGRQTSTASHLVEKNAQVPTSWGPVLPRPTLRSPSDLQNKSSSISYKTSLESKRPHARTASGSSSSSRSVDNTPKTKTTQALHKQVRPPMPREPGLSHQVQGRSSSGSSAHWSQEPVDAGLDSPAQVQVGDAVEVRKTLAQPAAIYPELDRYRDHRRPEDSTLRRDIDVPHRLATHDLPPLTPGSLWFSGSSQASAVSGSPSTKFSDSPGPGPCSRDTTPTSMSSHSPVFVAPTRVWTPYRNTRQHSASASRPPVTRRCAGSFRNDVDLKALEPNGLASVRESLTSSSSNSTVKDLDRSHEPATKEKTKRGRLPSPPPSPPPRLSLQKPRPFQNISEQPNMRGLQRDRSKEVVFCPQSPGSEDASSLSQTSPPARPSRHKTPNMEAQLSSTATPIIMSNLSSLGAEEHGKHGRGSLAGSTNTFVQTMKNLSTSNLPALEREGSAVSPKSRSSSDRQYQSTTEPIKLAQSSQANSRTSSRTIFSFFGRKKPKSGSRDKVDGKTGKENPLRKGPVAGTGHEGYGPVGAIRRRSGSGSALPHTVTNKPSSYNGLPKSDSFLADRINPVIISGGEVVENRNTSFDLARTEPSHAVSASGRRASDDVAMQSTLAFRRSVQRLQSSPDNPLRLPQPLNTSRHAYSPSPLTSFDTSILSDESHIELQRDTSGESSTLCPAPKQSQTRPRSPRRWNIFSRSRNQIDAKKDKKHEPVAATVGAVEKRPVAFYTILDASAAAEREETSPTDMQETWRDEDASSQTVKADIAADDTSFALQRELTPQNYDWSLRKSRKSPRDRSTTTTMASSSAVDSPHSMNRERPRRLLRVGRIPQVVTKPDESLPPRSFSRPLRASLHLQANNMKKADDLQPIAARPSASKSPNTMPKRSMENSTLDGGDGPVSNMRSNPIVPAHIVSDEKGFLDFASRNDSDDSIYASSRSPSAANPFAATTAVSPNSGDTPIDDEVWDEYNDLFSGDSTKGHQSVTTSTGDPFHPKTHQNQLTKHKHLDSSPAATGRCKSSTGSKARTNPTCHNAAVMERIRTTFHPMSNPTTGQIPIPVSARHGGGRSSARMARESQSRRSSPSSCRTTSSDCSACSSHHGTSLAQVNLRVGSMTVSKWLTFGHVLFSEIRHQLALVEPLAKGHSVLVIDGLGNDDWSFYAAETYSSALFFNLSPRAPLSSQTFPSPTTFPLSPPNHHQIQYTSHLDKFPFASQSFDAVVYRFPKVAPESHHRNILSEARRVLRPDGYIELSILDADLNNMGNLGRRTIRQLKEQIRLRNPDMSFASTADLIVRLLGKAGFVNIKAARVGVPVASSIAQPGSDGDENKSARGKKKDARSLAEMMQDDSPSADENITKIVTRVGRWWYTRCYERTAGITQERSIWNDKSLLSECEQLGTSLKLMVCCARAPYRTSC